MILTRPRLLLAFALAAVACGGCGVANVGNSGDLNKLLAQKKPVLVDFYKAGCEHCSAFDITFHKLAEDYAGKAVFGKFLLMQANGKPTAEDVLKKYNVLVYPTVILFVDGKESRRFEQDYSYDHYATALEAMIPAQKNKPTGKGTK